MISRTIVTTEDDEIAAIARRYGGDVPFRRPESLARDDSRIFQVIRHAVETLEADGDEPYADIVLIQPTCPLRVPRDLERCIRALWSTAADSVITVYRHPQIHPRIMYQVSTDGRAVPLWDGEDRMLPRQELEPVFIRTGAAYAFRTSLVRTHHDIYGQRTVAVEIPYARSFGIDDATDFRICDALLERATDHPSVDSYRPSCSARFRQPQAP